MNRSIAEWLKSDAKDEVIRYAVAPGPWNLNRIRLTTVRFCSMEFVPPRPATAAEFAKREPGVPTPTEELLNGMKVQVLEGAYVILIQMADGKLWLKPSVKNTCATRTDKVGNLIAIEPKEFDGEVPSGRRPLPLAPSGRYAYFWSLDKEIFKRVWSEVQADPRMAVKSHPFSEFVLNREVKYNKKVEEFLPVNADSSSTTLAGHLLFGVDMDGTMTGGMLEGLSARGVIDTSARYVVARSEALASLYVVELFNRLTKQRRALTAGNWATLRHARELASYAEEKKRHPDLDLHLPKVDRTKLPDHWFYRSYNDEYHEYAFQAAKAEKRRVTRDLFWQSVSMKATDAHAWEEPAFKIYEVTSKRVRHPSLELEGERLRWKPPPVGGEGVLRYFDLYRFGFEVDEPPKPTRISLAEQSIERLLSNQRNRLASYMKERAYYQLFMQELGAHVRNHSAERIAMHTAYVRAADTVGYPWWEDFFPESSQGVSAPEYEWSKLELYVAWIATLSSKLGDVMSEVFGAPNKVAEMNHLVAESTERFERLIKKMKDYDKRFTNPSPAKCPKLLVREGTKIEIDFEKGFFTIIAEEGREKIGPVHFIVTSEEAAKEGAGSVRSGQVAVKKYRRHALSIKELKGKDLPFKEVHTVPLWLQTFGNVLSAAIVIKNLSEDLASGKDKVTVVGLVAAYGLQAVSSVASSIRLLSHSKETLACLKAADKALVVAEKLGPLGNVAEALVNVHDGYILLFGGEESEISRALDAGETVVARVLKFKGVVLISTAGPLVWVGGAAAGSAMGLVEGAALELALSGLAYYLAGAAVVVIAIDSYIYGQQGPSDAMQGIREAFETAFRDEFGADKASRFRVSRTADGLAAYGENVEASLLASVT